MSDMNDREMNRLVTGVLALMVLVALGLVIAELCHLLH